MSDGSEDSDDGEPIELVLAGSRMGLMRRGIHHQMLVSFVVCTQVLICDMISQTRVYLCIFLMVYFRHNLDSGNARKKTRPKVQPRQRKNNKTKKKNESKKKKNLPNWTQRNELPDCCKKSNEN